MNLLKVSSILLKKIVNFTKKMFRTIAVILMLTFFVQGLYPFIIHHQSFPTNAMPAGWTTTALQGSATWIIRNNPGFGSMSGGYYAVFDDEALGASVTPNEAVLTSPVFNCTNHLAVYLRIQHHWYGVEGTYGYIEISNNGGSTWKQSIRLKKLPKEVLQLHRIPHLILPFLLPIKQMSKLGSDIMTEIKQENFGM